MNTWYNRYAALAIGGALSMGGYEAIAWSKLTPSDWGTWFGAIGTIGALVGAIWIATGERRRRESEARDLATIAAAGVLLRISRINAALGRVADHLSTKFTAGGGPDFRYCAGQIKLVGLWDVSEIVPLVALPNHAAAKLAFASTLLKNLEESFDDALHEARPLNLDTTATLQQIHVIRVALHIALRECKKLTSEMDFDSDG